MRDHTCQRGNVLRQIDARGGVKTFTYDDLDNVLTETNQLNKTTTYTYDAADNRTSIADPLNNVTQFIYNNAHQDNCSRKSIDSKSWSHFMNEAFERLNEKLSKEEIDISTFLLELKTIGDFRDDLWLALEDRFHKHDWRHLSKLIWAVSLAPDARFTPLLCRLLEHPYDGYMEAIADSLREIHDQNTVSCIRRALDYHVYGDDGRHFNRALLDALYRIGTKDAIGVIEDARWNSDELTRSHAQDFLSRIQNE